MESEPSFYRRPPVVLVVDDIVEVRQSIRKIVESLRGAVVIEAATSEEALELASQRDFDLVTSDLTRLGMGGFEFLSAFKKISPGTRVVIVSSVLHLPGFKERALSLGATACLEKPFTTQQFLQVFREALGWAIEAA